MIDKLISIERTRGGEILSKRMPADKVREEGLEMK